VIANHFWLNSWIQCVEWLQRSFVQTLGVTCDFYHINKNPWQLQHSSDKSHKSQLMHKCNWTKDSCYSHGKAYLWDLYSNDLRIPLDWDTERSEMLWLVITQCICYKVTAFTEWKKHFCFTCLQSSDQGTLIKNGGICDTVSMDDSFGE